MLATAAPRSLQQWLDWQLAQHPNEIQLGLERVRAVAERLQLPGRRPLTITVAGTNGKGSTAKLLAEYLRAAGKRAGLYTSPHLLAYNERVVVDGEAANDEVLCEAFARIRAAQADTPLTYFEYGTLAALLIFSQRQVEVQVLEVGLGGRLDACNIVDADCAVITSIGMDHQAWLGDSLAAIAAEKAGIMRAGKPVVSAADNVQSEITALAAKAGAHLLHSGGDYRHELGAQQWSWHCGGKHIEALPIPLACGEHQISNAAAALTALWALRERLPFDETAFRQALRVSALPGRAQRQGRYCYDVSHNPQAASALLKTLKSSPGRGRRLAVLGMLADKDVAGYVSTLAPALDQLFLAGLAPDTQRAQSAVQLAERVGSVFDGPVSCHADVASALCVAEAAAGADDEILVCGSFHTVAEAMEHRHG